MFLYHIYSISDSLSVLMLCPRERSQGEQWLSGRVLDSRPRGCGFEPLLRHCVVVLEQDIYPSLVLIQPRKTRPCLTERLLMGRKELNKQTINALSAKVASAGKFCIQLRPRSGPTKSQDKR